MKNSNLELGEEGKAAKDVIEDQSQDRATEVNEQTQFSKRRGRVTQSPLGSGSEPNGSRFAQSARGLGAASETTGQVRIIISPETNRHLDDLAARVNTGFDAGKVTRPQILSWVIRRFVDLANDDDIQELRAAHFDKIAYLEALLKRAKETGTLPQELQAALQPPIAATAQKKSKKPLTKNIINGEIIIDDAS